MSRQMLFILFSSVTSSFCIHPHLLRLCSRLPVLTRAAQWTDCPLGSGGCPGLCGSRSSHTPSGSLIPSDRYAYPWSHRILLICYRVEAAGVAVAVGSGVWFWLDRSWLWGELPSLRDLLGCCFWGRSPEREDCRWVVFLPYTRPFLC